MLGHVSDFLSNSTASPAPTSMFSRAACFPLLLIVLRKLLLSEGITSNHWMLEHNAQLARRQAYLPIVHHGPIQRIPQVK
jgi:hypothetical protein